MRTPTWCRRRAAEIGPACVAVIDELLAENALFRLRAAQGVLGLADKHDPARLEAACAKATAAGDPSYRTIKGILAAGTETDPTARPTGDGGAAAHLHGPASCSPTPIADVDRRCRRRRHPPAHRAPQRRHGPDHHDPAPPPPPGRPAARPPRTAERPDRRGPAAATRSADPTAIAATADVPAGTPSPPGRSPSSSATSPAPLTGRGGDPPSGPRSLARKTELFARIAAAAPRPARRRRPTPTAPDEHAMSTPDRARRSSTTTR